jgi:RHS repeat-associated protein
MRVAICSEEVRFPSAHFTGKERDAESGNDYFGARYYSSAMGRFMSPDWSAKIAPVPYAKLDNPQSLNLYSYVFNNPLIHVDPDGHWVPLTGDEASRRKQLEALQNSVGKQAGGYLYDNVVDGKHYVGIYTNGPDGKGPSFESINKVSSQLGAIIGDTGREASIQFVSPGTKVGNKTVGPTDANQTPAVTQFSRDGRSATINVTSGGFGEMNGRLTSDGHSTWNSFADILSHEFGHIDSTWYHGGVDSNGNSVRMENTTRQFEGGPLRVGHDIPYDVQFQPGGTSY